MSAMTINLWKLSSFAFGGLFIAAVAWNHIPTAQADDVDAPIKMDACDDQGEMQAALEDLRYGRHRLHLAAHNKGDHRRVALARVQEGINQVEAGCQFANDVRDDE